MKAKKFISVLLALLMMLTTIPFAYAQEEPEKECEHDNGTYVSKEEKGISTTEEYWTEEISCSTCGKVLVPSIVFPPAPMCYAEHENSDIKICDYCEKKCLNENYEITSIMSPDNKVYSLIDGNAVIVSPCRPNSFGLGPYTDSLLDYYLTSDPQVIRYKGMINEKNHCLFFTVEEDHCEIYTFIDMENGFYIHDMYIMNVPEESSESLIGKVDLEYVINLISQFEYSSNIQIDEDNNHVTYISKEAASPTATEPGRTEERTCAICEQVIKASEEIPAIVNEGQCGDNAYWNYDADSKTITVSGTGEMWDVTESKYGFPIPFGNAYANYAEKIVIGEGVTKVGNSAFFGFKCVNEITLPASLKEISQYAFAWNYNLRKIDFGEGLEVIGCGAFNDCAVISEVVLPSSVKRMESSAFSGCYNLKNIRLNEGLEYLAEDALSNTFSLEEIEIPSTVKEIGDMTEIVFSSPVKNIINNSPTVVIFDEEIFDGEGKIEFPTERSREIVAYTYSTLYSLIAQVYLTPEKPYDDEVDEVLRQKTIEAVNEKFGTSYKSIDDIDYEYFDAVYNLPDYITISCLHDSDQHEQCKEFSIDHSIIDSTCDDDCGIHNIYTNDIMEPTCTENGYEGGVVCLDCEKIFEAATVIPATGHTPIKTEGLKPTCTEIGFTDSVVCEVCDETISVPTIIPPTGHTDKNNDGVCDSCGAEIDGFKPQPKPQSFGDRIISVFKGIVDSILTLFRKLFG